MFGGGRGAAQAEERPEPGTDQEGHANGPVHNRLRGRVTLAGEQDSIGRGRRGSQVARGHRRVHRPVTDSSEDRALQCRDEGHREDDDRVAERSGQRADDGEHCDLEHQGEALRPV